VHARKSYEHPDIRFGHRYAEILGTTNDGRLRIDYGRFHETLEGMNTTSARTNIFGEKRGEHDKQDH
jgi:hypothetical protein